MFTKNAKLSAGAWDDEILLTTSSDGGATWTGPRVIHKLANDMPTFTPTVAVNGGRGAGTDYDNPHLQPRPTANWATPHSGEDPTARGPPRGREQPITGP